MKYNPHKYQSAAIEHIKRNPYCGLFLDMGLGKTVITLTALQDLMMDFEVSKILVIAPKKVAESTWASECEKWDHLSWMRVSVALGTEKQRSAALRENAEIYVTSRDNVAWIVGKYAGQEWPFDVVVIDELSSFKNHQSQRFKALRHVRPYITRVIGLTGTPAPNSMIDLWAQVFLLDMGKRLGMSIGRYRSEYFTPGRGNGMIVYDYKIREGAAEKISRQIGDICISMKAEDYLQLPDRIDKVEKVRLPQSLMDDYEEFEKDQVLAIQEDEIQAASAAALSIKLRQFANGAIYNDDRDPVTVHEEKLDALEETIEAANGQPVLVFYQFKHDASRIMNRLRKYKPVMYEGDETLRAWNDGKISILLAHPASTAYGLNMQAGGHIVIWYGVDWNLELYQQANARLHRQGQSHPVTVIHLITKGTIEEKVLAALNGKKRSQDALLDAVKAIVTKYRRI